MNIRLGKATDSPRSGAFGRSWSYAIFGVVGRLLLLASSFYLVAEGGSLKKAEG
jgi:hypothetical protein